MYKTQFSQQTDDAVNLFEKKNLLLSFLLCAVLIVVALLISVSPLSKLFTEKFLGLITILLLLAGSVFLWRKYLKNGSPMFLCFSLWLSVLTLWEGHEFLAKGLSGWGNIFYLFLFFGALGYGGLKKKRILEALKQNELLLVLWGATLLLYGAALFVGPYLQNAYSFASALLLLVAVFKAKAELRA